MSGAASEGAEAIRVGLTHQQTTAVEEAHKMRYPLPLTGTALQLFQLAQLKGLGMEPEIAVSKVWDTPEGPLFARSSA